tara:strand:- start:4831 stop:6780 length:1950 start_codon:yes stop_codon:yes gene_type:complete
MSLKSADPVLDVLLPSPDPRFSAANFQYNFFVPDESVDDLGEAARRIDGGELDLNDLSDKPRFVRIQGKTNLFRPSNNREYVPPLALPENVTPLSRLLTSQERSDIVSKINNHVDMQTSALFSSINFQDLNVNDKLYNLLTTTVKKKILEANNKVQDSLNVAKEEFLSNSFQSQTDLVRVARRQVPVDDDFLRRSLTQIEKINEAFIDPQEQAQIISDNFNTIKKASFNGQFNTKFISSCAQAAVNDTIGSYAEEMLLLKDALSQAQARASSDYMPNDVNPDRLSLEFLSTAITTDVNDNPLAIDDVSENALEFFLAGHLINKLEILQDGNIVRKDLIFLDEPSEYFEHVDFNVAYCRSYAYIVSAVYLCRVRQRRSQDPESEEYNQGIERFFLMASQTTPALTVTCQENVPPLAPDDMKIHLHTEKNKPLITWRHPLNVQRDIKRFQVLRRSTIDEPFELLVEYDFDNSVVKHKSLEHTAPELKVIAQNPVTFFIDEDFDTSKEYIYTLRSVDAHGLLSTYGEQIAVKYDPFRNELDTSLVSTRGAPAHLPNYFLISRMFSPTVKDSNHTRLKVYFDPEYLKLVKNDKENDIQDLRLFRYDGLENSSPTNAQPSRTSQTARYKLQILNTDLQQSRIVDIFISDNRTDQ